MGKAATAWSTLRHGGVGELFRRTRSWGARALDPGSSPPADARAVKPGLGPTPFPTAANVSFPTATRFFEERHSSYEHLADAIAPYLDRGGVLLDVGANIGYFTKVVAERTGFRGDAHLFEPVPHLAKFCLRTLADVEFGVTVHQFGLSDTDGRVQLHLGITGNYGWNTMIGSKGSDVGMATHTITVRRFDGIGLTAVPTVIKIDVEGAEYLVLRGLLPALERMPTRPVILCEIGWGSEHPNWQQELEAFDRLTLLGYHALTLDGLPLNVRGLTATSDVLFVPEDRVPA